MPTASCLLKHFDAFGWVPTIRGALSLDLFQSAINNIGDVDKHSVAFRKYDGQRKEFYLAATSLETTVDRKYKKKYAKTFRTFFTGVINNCEQTYQSISDIASDDEASSFISEHTALFGKVTIVVEVKNKISDKEREAIEKIRSLADLYGDYRKQYSIDTVPFEEIDKTRGKMLELWKEYKADVESIAEDPNFIVYNFEVVLLRSGLLFIKDINSDCRIKDYAEPRTVADYRTNTPLPRIFKYVMNYVKYLFHANYHHNQKHDTYLPASNLHPLRNGNVTSFDRVFQHQIDSFLNPIVRMKRKDFSDNAINPVGVILYAKSFVNICFTHGLISEDLKDNTLAHLEIQEDEINEMTGFRKSFLNSMLKRVISYSPFLGFWLQVWQF